MTKVISYLKKYWFIPVVLIAVAVLGLKKKSKVTSSNKDEDANSALESARIREQASKDYYKSVALQIAEGLGTAYDWFDPRRWYEKDERVYELVSELNAKDFQVVSSLYFEVYAKGRNLSEDLAKHLDAKLYSLLKIK